MKNKGGRTYRFYCDHCLKKDLDSKNNIFYESKKWVDLRDYTAHLQSKLHKKCVEKDTKEKVKYCKECDEYYSEEGYKQHACRNAEMWKMKRIVKNDWTCNRFKKDGKLYSSFAAMKYGTEDYKKEIVSESEEENESEEEVNTSDEELFIDEFNGDYSILEDPIPTGDICNVCNKLEYYSYTNHNEILTEIEKDYLRYNQNITNYCDCVDEDYKPNVINLISDSE